MYGLPSAFDATFFVGRQLVQVALTENTLHLAFDGDVSVTIESGYRHRGLRGAQEAGEMPVRSSAIMSLLGRVVRHAAGETDGTLTLTFEDDQQLVCLDDQASFESHKISNRGTETVV